MATNVTTQPPIVDPMLASTGSATAVTTAPYTRTIPYRRVYVWELPVRLYHWINAVAILLLFATGILIGWPQTLWMAQEPSQQYWFGWVRFIHFASAYVFLFNILFRLYWSFVGNEYARWSVYIPYKKEQLESLRDTILVDITQIKERGDVSVGHNYMAAFTYLMLLFLSVFQIVTGFGLYASMTDAWLPQFFGWIVPLMGGDANVRQWHHIVTWAFPIFALIHVYLACYHDFVEGRGTLSSIVDGWKFERDDEFKK
jgi:Ni/Fe-hydrogenase 1 B-type cytochrome subunit